MNKTEYNEIINGTETYKEISNKLRQHIPVIIGWTDEACTHLDILFTYQAYREYGNYLQRGFMPTDLFVSILSWGAYGFEVDREKNVGYIYIRKIKCTWRNSRKINRINQWNNK